jgi:hypothetical protein
MTLTTYLGGVTFACDQERRATETAAQLALPFNELMQEEFKQRFSHVCDKLEALQERLARAESTVNSIKSQSWWRRLYTKPSIKDAQEILAHLKVAESVAQRAVDTAWESFETEEESTGTVKAAVANSSAAKFRYNLAGAVRNQTASFRAKFANYQSMFPHAPATFSFPEIPANAPNSTIVQDAGHALKTAEDRLDRFIKALEPTRAAATAANKILAEFIADSDEATRKESSTHLEPRTRASLNKLTRIHNLPTLINHLEVCTWPHQFHSYADWFVFWSATKAGVEYSIRADGTTINEPPKVSWWCAGWLNAVKSWDISALANIGLNKSSVANALFMLENSKVETESGADVLIMLVVGEAGQQYCGVASIQFKRGTENSSLIALNQSYGRQYDALASKYWASNKRWRGIYASLQSDGGGLSSVPAVLIEDTFVPAQIDTGQYTYEVRKAGIDEASVDWTANGEALATALATCLSNRNAVFGSVDEAFDWATNSNLDKLPDYVVVQTIGESELSLERARKRLGDLAAQSSQKYALINSLTRRRSPGLDPEPPTPGHGFGRGR